MKPQRFRIIRIAWYTWRYWWLTQLIEYERRRSSDQRLVTYKAIRRWGDLHHERGRVGMLLDVARGMGL